MTDRDWPAVRAIYEAGIATGNATFETTAPSWDRWDATHLPDHRLVAITPDATSDGAPGTGSPSVPGGPVVGWAALAPVSDRCAYAGVAENSVYVDPAHHGRGIGRTLLLALLQQAEAAGIWTVQSGIFPENTASVAVHQRCGFRIVGRRERLGRLHGTWRDVLLLERRSPTIT
ncbi:MAG TPA: GNAT family N-acetyltransferase [Kineosporiaceae bacterium]|nr:GNAT family N-acetyltransferase [Kineosporiaceae bacterium]